MWLARQSIREKLDLLCICSGKKGVEVQDRQCPCPAAVASKAPHSDVIISANPMARKSDALKFEPEKFKMSPS